MCTLLTMKANIWSRWPCFCQRIKQSIHSAWGGNGLYMQLIDQLSYSEKWSIFTDPRFIMEKKLPYLVFLALFHYRGCHAMAPKALILKHLEQITKCIASKMDRENSMAKQSWAKLGKSAFHGGQGGGGRINWAQHPILQVLDSTVLSCIKQFCLFQEAEVLSMCPLSADTLSIKSSLPAFLPQPTHSVSVWRFKSGGSTEMNFKKRLNFSLRPEENCSAISRLSYRVMHQEKCPGLATKTLFLLRIPQKSADSNSKKGNILKLQLLQGLNTQPQGYTLCGVGFSENNILISTLIRAPHLVPTWAKPTQRFQSEAASLPHSSTSFSFAEKQRCSSFVHLPGHSLCLLNNSAPPGKLRFLWVYF